MPNDLLLLKENSDIENDIEIDIWERLDNFKILL